MSSSRKTATTSSTVGKSCSDREPLGLEAGHAGARGSPAAAPSRPRRSGARGPAAGGRARRGGARAAGRARRRRSRSGRRRSGRPGPGAAARRGGGRGRRRSARRGGRRASAPGRSGCSGRGTWRWPRAGPGRSRSPARRWPARCRRSRPRRAGRARARTGGGRRWARRATLAPHRPQPAAEHVRRPPLGVGAGPAPLERAQLPDQLHASRLVHERAHYRRIAGLSFRGRRSGGTGIRAALKMPCPSGHVGSNPTSGICADASRSPTPTRGCSSSASTCARRRRSRTRSRASTWRRPTPCWPSGWTRRASASWGGCAGG